MELRQLRYFVILAEELHFGRAAAREHIVQSALSQQLQRLERELGVLLIERTTHHVQLSPAGAAFLIEARHILAHVDRAAVAAQRAAGSARTPSSPPTRTPGASRRSSIREPGGRTGPPGSANGPASDVRHRASAATCTDRSATRPGNTCWADRPMTAAPVALRGPRVSTACG
jgi:Bacterial regulatory helix-turn-helix protein, lysR family